MPPPGEKESWEEPEGGDETDFRMRRPMFVASLITLILAFVIIATGAYWAGYYVGVHDCLHVGHQLFENGTPADGARWCP